MLRQSYFQQAKACGECGGYFEATRAHARFCSSTCRTSSHRSGLKRNKLLKRIKGDMAKLLEGNIRPEIYELILDDIQDAIDSARIQVIS